jgi:hypothetical protein
MKLTPLFEQGVTGYLMRIRSLLEQKMAQLLVNLHVEEQGYPQDDSPVFSSANIRLRVNASVGIGL